jgi:hypothetical protein
MRRLFVGEEIHFIGEASPRHPIPPGIIAGQTSRFGSALFMSSTSVSRHLIIVKNN